MPRLLGNIASSSRLGARALAQLGSLQPIDEEPEGPRVLAELKILRELPPLPISFLNSVPQARVTKSLIDITGTRNYLRGHS